MALHLFMSMVWLQTALWVVAFRQDKSVVAKFLGQLLCWPKCTVRHEPKVLGNQKFRSVTYGLCKIHSTFDAAAVTWTSMLSWNCRFNCY